MDKFNATLEIIDGNPFVYVPPGILENIFQKAGRRKGPVPVKGMVNGNPFLQTLFRFRGDWRFYINTTILKNSPKRIGENIEVEIEFDPDERTVEPHPKWIKALDGNKDANEVFKKLSPSKQKEIVRYISYLKTEQSVDRNVTRAINFLLGKERFVGRERP